MYQTEIVISVATIIIAFVLSALNVFKKRQFTINRLYVIIAFLSSVLFFLQLLLLLKFKYLTTTMNTRFYFSLIHFLSLLFFTLIQIFPNEKLRPRLGIVLMTWIPSLIMSTVCAWTELVIPYAEFTTHLSFQLGILFPVYLLLTAFFLIGSLFILIYKSRFTLKSKVLSKELQYISYGLILSIFLLLFMSFFIPMMFNIDLTRNIGITLPGISIIIILNYAVYDIRVIDFKKFNLAMMKWIILSLMAFVPVYLLFNLTGSYIFATRINGLTTGIMIFLYLVFFFEFIKGPIDDLFDLEYRRLGNTFEKFFQSISTFNLADENGVKWQEFYAATINQLVKTFGITQSLYYQYDPDVKKFILTYGEISRQGDREMNSMDSIVQSIADFPGIIDRTLIYTDTLFEGYRDRILEFFDRYNLQVTVPFFIYGEQQFGIPIGDKRLAAFLILGPLPFRQLYSKTFLSALDIYRLQFQRLLASGLVLEDVRQKQITVHDQMVVEDIKKKIIPQTMANAGHVRASSLHINNSNLGGDYFDSIIIGNSHAVYLLTETGYNGIESAINALQIHSGFHLKLNQYRSPENLMASLNWIVMTSQYSQSYIPATAAVINARGEVSLIVAGTPAVLLFDPQKNEHTSLNSRGVPLGVEKSTSYKTISVTPPKNAIMVLFSSGLEAAIDSQGRNYSIDRLKKVIRENSDQTPAVLSRALYRDYLEFTGERDQLNDINVIFLKF